MSTHQAERQSTADRVARAIRRYSALIALFWRHRQVIWECWWRSRCEWTGWQKLVAEFVFQAAAAVMIWFQTAKRLVISVRHSGALIR